jgi:hypothetical protein
MPLQSSTLDRRERVAGLVERAFYYIALAALALVVVSSVTRPSIPFDSWYYHLPFSAYLLNIGNARETLLFSPGIQELYAGFPLFAELLQGGLWRLTGTISATTLLNSLGLALFVLAAVRVTKADLPILTFGILSVPLVVIHSVSTYIDLFSALLICLQVLAASLMVDKAHPIGARPTGTRLGSFADPAVLYVAAAAAAGNTKFMALVISLAISVYLLAFVAVQRGGAGLARDVKLIATIGIASALSGATCARNLWEYGNPFYPIAVGPFPGPWKEYQNYPLYTQAIGWLGRPINWVLSITETDWIIRGVKVVYNIDLHAGDEPDLYGPARTGGYWGSLVISSLVVGAALLARTAERNPRALQDHKFLLSSLLFLTVLTAFMPQSHELRYYLHWPLLLFLALAILVRTADLQRGARLALCGLYLAFFLLSELSLRAPLRIFPVYSPEKDIAQLANSPVVALARRNGGTCLSHPYYPEEMKYSAIFHGGRYAIEQGHAHLARTRGETMCRRFPLYAPQ